MHIREEKFHLCKLRMKMHFHLISRINQKKKVGIYVRRKKDITHPGWMKWFECLPVRSFASVVRHTHSNKLCNCILKQMQKMRIFHVNGQAADADSVAGRHQASVADAYSISIYRKYNCPLRSGSLRICAFAFLYTYYVVLCVCLLCCLMLSILIKQESRMSVC